MVPQRDFVDSEAQALQRRRRRFVLVLWAVFWGCAVVVAAIAAVSCTILRGFSFGFAAWVGTLIIAGLVFLPLWLITSAVWLGARAGTAVQQRLRDRGRR